MNTLKCKDCANFDEQFKNEQVTKTNNTRANVRRSLWYGYCKAQSIYPAKEQDGQVFPHDVQRRDPEVPQLADLKTVDKNGVVANCVHAMKAT